MVNSCLLSQELPLFSRSTATGLPSNFILDITDGQNGEILLSSDIGLSRFDGKRFQTTIANKPISLLYTTNKKQFYTHKNEVFKLGLDKKAFITLPQKEEIIGLQFWKNHWCVLTQNAVYIYNKEKLQKKHIVNDYALKLSLYGDNCYITTSNKILGLNNSFELKSILNSDEWIVNSSFSGNDVLLLTQSSIATYNLTSKKLIRKKEVSQPLDILKFGKKKQLLLTKDSVYIIENNKASALQNQGFINHSITKIKQTQNGVFWFITEGKGVHYTPDPNQLIYTKEFNVHSVIHFQNTNYLGTNVGLIKVQSGNKQVNLLPGKDVLSLVVVNQTLVAATKEGCFLLKGSLVTKVSEEPVENLIATSNGAIIYGFTQSKGIWKYDMTTKKEEFIGISKGLSHNAISDIGLMNDTLIILPEKGKINFVFDGKIISHPLERVLKIQQYKRIALHKKQLFLLTSNGNLEVFTCQGLQTQSLSISHLVSEMYLVNDNIILFGLQEFSVYSMSSRTIRNKGLSSQLKNQHYSENCISRNGYFILGMENGYTVFDKDYFNEKSKFETTISEIRINGKPSEIIKNIQLASGVYRFQIKLSSPDFSDNNKEKYYWKVKNYSNEYLLLQDETLDLFQLKEGTYELSIMNSNKEEVIRTVIAISKPFWKQTWFIIIFILFISISFFSILHFRTKKLKKDSIRLNKLVEERTAALNERNQEMTAVSHAISHDVLTPLKTIKQLAELQSSPVFPESAKKEGLGFLQQTASNVVSNVTGLIGFLNLETEQDQSEWVHFTTLLEDIRTLILAQYNDSNAFLCVDVQCDKIEVNKSFITSIFQNLISNSIKYSKKDISPRMHVRVFAEKDFVVIEIEDNGIGMDLSKFGDNLFAPFKQIDNSSTGFGLGLSIVFKMIKKLEGNISVESELGKGTKWKIVLPVNAEI